MPAARACRACGTRLPADVRWCGLCHAPVREFTPRMPLHQGDFVGMPTATGGYRPHWSRWDRSPTTFGPAGRIVATLLFLATLPLALQAGNFMYLFVFPVVAVVVLGGIWAPGWIVPGEIELPPVPEAFRIEPAPEPLPATAMVVFRVVAWTVGVGALLVFAYGPTQAKAAVLALTVLGGLYAFFRGFLVR